MKPPAVGRNALEALQRPSPARPAARSAPAAPASGSDKWADRRVNVILGEEDPALIERIERLAPKRAKLGRSSITRAMLRVLAHVEDRVDFSTLTGEEALTAAVLGLLRPK